MITTNARSRKGTGVFVLTYRQSNCKIVKLSSILKFLVEYLTLRHKIVMGDQRKIGRPIHFAANPRMVAATSEGRHKALYSWILFSFAQGIHNIFAITGNQARHSPKAISHARHAICKPNYSADIENEWRCPMMASHHRHQLNRKSKAGNDND